MDQINGKNHSHQDGQESKSVVIAKKEEDGLEAITCKICTKLFKNENAYYTHVRTKHSQQKSLSNQLAQPSSVNQQEKKENSVDKKSFKRPAIKNKMLQGQQNQLEDTIYAFLGELGEKNAETVTNRSEFILHNENQRSTGHTNYSLNKVVRTPYEQPIKASDNLPNAEIQQSQYKNFLLQLKEELKQLEQKVEAEKEIWELRDPMAPQQQIQDEFSLMDIRKLIANYPKRKLKLIYPHFSIFVLWVARICKPPAFKEFFMVIGTYLAKFSSVEEHRDLKQDTCYELWRSYFKANESKLIEKQMVDKLQICKDKNCKKLIEYFVDWSDKFRAMII